MSTLEDSGHKYSEAKQQQDNEVAKIRYEHYQNRRFRKLAMISKAAEMEARRKIMEKARADAEYEDQQNDSKKKTYSHC